MPSRLDAIGKTFGKLKVLEYAGTRKESCLWKCSCECGAIKFVTTDDFKRRTGQACTECLLDQGLRRKISKIVGSKFGRLIVVGMSKQRDDQGRKCVDCICECGKTLCVPYERIRNADTLSCGCLKRDRTVQSNIERCVTPDSGLKVHYRTYFESAKHSGREFFLTFDEFREIVLSDCHYCGASPAKEVRSAAGHSPRLVNGVDRKDNTVGYLLYNCLPCCSVCNHAKHVLPYADFLAWLDRIAEFRSPKLSLVA